MLDQSARQFAGNAGGQALASMLDQAVERHRLADEPATRQAVMAELAALAARDLAPGRRERIDAVRESLAHPDVHGLLREFEEAIDWPARRVALSHLRELAGSDATVPAERASIAASVRQSTLKAMAALLNAGDDDQFSRLDLTPRSILAADSWVDRILTVGSGSTRVLEPWPPSSLERSALAASGLTPYALAAGAHALEPRLTAQTALVMAAVGSMAAMFMTNRGLHDAAGAANRYLDVNAARLLTRQVARTPIVDSTGTDRAPEVATLLHGLLDPLSNAEVRLSLAARLLLALAVRRTGDDGDVPLDAWGAPRQELRADRTFATALADFATTLDDDEAARALTTILDHPLWRQLTPDVTALFDPGRGAQLDAIDERNVESQKAMAELNLDSASLVDKVELKLVTGKLGGRPPIRNESVLLALYDHLQQGRLHDDFRDVFQSRFHELRRDVLGQPRPVTSSIELAASLEVVIAQSFPA